MAAFRPLYTIRVAVVQFASSLVGLLDGGNKGNLALEAAEAATTAPATTAPATPAPAHAEHHEDDHERPSVIDSLERLIQWIGKLTKSIEGGNYQVYCVYIMAALALLLLLNMAFG
jgi:hypothetical protein